MSLKDRGTLLKAFTTYVRPLLEYATPVWSPFTVTDYQNRISTAGFHKATTWTMPPRIYQTADVLCTESLELRRLRYDLIYVYKMLFGLIDFSNQ